MFSPTDLATPSPSRRPLTYIVDVFGCKVNQCEAREIERELERRGLRGADEGERADVAVVHTCAVTSTALAESRRRLAQLDRPGTLVVASGCGAGLLPEHVRCDATVPAGPGWSASLRAALDGLLGAPTHPEAAERPRRFTGHARAFVKVQDGCDLGCAYCIVPRLRGPPRDRPLESIVAEVQRYVRVGHAEVVLSGVSIGLWGRDRDEELADVVAAVARVRGLRRLRLSSLHPLELTDRLLDTMRSHPNVAPHLHLPLQSGSDAVLRRMRRRYTVADFVEAVARARAALEEPAITTDVMAGFPGETPADFDATVQLCRAVGFSRMHVFAFSARPGTAAAALPGRLAAPEIRRRAAELRTLGRELALAWHRRWVGREVELLVERWSPATGRAAGHCARYCAVETILPARPDEAGVVRVRVTAADADGLRGEPIASMDRSTHGGRLRKSAG